MFSSRNYFCSFGLFVLGVAFAVGVILYLKFHGPGIKSNSSKLAYFNESFILSYSSVYCQSISVESKPFVGAILYLLDKTPKLTDHDSFNISRHFVFLDNGWEYYQFYLYPGSSISMNVCASLNAPKTTAFLFIKGDSNFKKWQDTSMPCYVNHSFEIVRLCSDMKQHHFSLLVNEVNNFYLIFVGKTTVEVSLYLYRTKYAISHSSVLSFCAINPDYETCYLDTPYNEDKVALVVIDPPVSVENDNVWLNTYTVMFKCQDRISLLTGIGVSVFVFMSVLAILSAVGLYCLTRVTYKLVRGVDSTSDVVPTIQTSLNSDRKLSGYGTM